MTTSLIGQVSTRRRSTSSSGLASECASHGHDDAVAFVVAGVTTCVAGNRSSVLRAGDSMFVPRGEFEMAHGNDDPAVALIFVVRGAGPLLDGA